MEKFFKASQRSIAAILTLCILLGIAGIGVYATSIKEDIFNSEEELFADEEKIFGSEKELQPARATACESTTIYVHSSIHINGNVPNATYVYCSGGGGGEIGGAIAGGTIYSIAKMNDLGQTIWRQDLNSYNGSPLHHGSIYGPHQHNYTWSSYTNASGSTFWNFVEEVFGLT